MVDDAQHRHIVFDKGDKRAEDRPPGDEAASPVDRVEHPDPPGVFADIAIFLANDPVCGERAFDQRAHCGLRRARSEEHTSELQSLMRISYAVFCLKKKKKQYNKL